MFKRSPSLTYLYGALDTTPPPPKVSSFALLIFKFSPALVFIPGEEEQASKAANQGERSGRHSGHDHARGLPHILVNINIGIIRIILVNMANWPSMLEVLLAIHFCCIIVSPLNLHFFGSLLISQIRPNLPTTKPRSWWDMSLNVSSPSGRRRKSQSTSSGEH